LACGPNRFPTPELKEQLWFDYARVVPAETMFQSTETVHKLLVS